ncbi:MAG: metal-dependent hydrolase [Saprospiraceae bacterium]|nr:metal-dependent hydrolase [Saprospiraceae bacterium]
MDSLTQITLGAAVGEAVLGRKAGNRAMLWGAVGGTIPDLDVFANFVTDEMTALAFHRGISHSFFFAVLAPFAFGWLTHRLYQSGLYQRTGYRVGASVIVIGFVLGFVNLVPYLITQNFSLPVLVWTLGIGAFFLLLLWLFYWRKPAREVHTSYRDWVLLWFWAIFTHPLLDACTPYGTQLFQPFWDYRVAFNTIAVVDPIYTLPFLLCLLIAMRFTREHPRRRWFNWLGISLSSAYLVFTFYHKMRIDSIFERSLQEQGITYHRYTTSPTIFNNVLWQGTAEGDTAYYHGMYSFFDPEERVTSFATLPKNHDLLEGLENERDLRILRWFSKDYYNVLRRPDGTLQLNDLRYGSGDGTFDEPSDYIFRFTLEEKNGRWVAHQTREDARVDSGAFRQLWDRMMGKVEQ